MMKECIHRGYSESLNCEKNIKVKTNDCYKIGEYNVKTQSVTDVIALVPNKIEHH